nr:uncharacterized protein LOC123745466 [Procambarus clarkii]
MDCLLSLEHRIMDTYRRRRVLLAAFFDIKSAFDSASHSAVLQSLAQLGLSGPALRWFQNYLQGRSFKVAVGGVVSTSRPVSRGVHQGAILSPLLFSILLSDLPVFRGVQVLAYANDVTLVADGATLLEAQRFLQNAVTVFSATVLGKGLSINSVKSCVMSFTWTRLPDQPVVTVRGCCLPIATEHRWLGVVLDSPRLTWRHHVDYLRASCLRRVNIMKRVSGAAWRASRESLLALYKAFIRSRIMYASEVYGSAAASVLARLDPIQNGALRSALGAMPSSPVLSLHAESGLWPLSFQHLLAHCRQFKRIVRLPATNPLTRLQLEANWWNVPAGHSRRHLRASLYSGYLEVYTDGSRKDQPPSTSAAAYFAPFSFCQTWKLSPAHSCLAGELFAILQALRLLRQVSGPSAVVFYVDSVTALHLISSRRSRVYRHTVSQNRGELLSYSGTPGWSIYLQWVPSHVGIKGNEVADAAAGMAHALHDSTNVPLDLSEILSQLRAACLASWEAMMEPALRSSSLAGLREDSSPRPWTRHHSRLLDTAITRLRIGHTCLAAHLHRPRLIGNVFSFFSELRTITSEALKKKCERLANVSRRPEL